MCIRRSMHTLKSEKSVIQILYINHKQVIICYYLVISIFRCSVVSLRENLSLLVFGIFEHAGTLYYISWLVYPFLYNKKENIELVQLLIF